MMNAKMATTTAKTIKLVQTKSTAILASLLKVEKEKSKPKKIMIAEIKILILADETPFVAPSSELLKRGFSVAEENVGERALNLQKLGVRQGA